MNGPFNGASEEQVWERPWSLDEISRNSQNWSLGADAGLLNFLREFSQQIISKTHDIEKQLDGLIRETKAVDCRLHNVFNDFLMLSNTQFIENRVYDEEIEEHIAKPDSGDKPEQEKSREQIEAELIPKIQEAVNYGLQVLESAFEQLDIKAGNSDSEDEEVNGRVELILEPKDLYIDRPLPHLIGSQLFMQQDDVGLGDISSEEGSVDNDRGSIIDSEEEEEDEEKDNEESDDDDFGNSEDDKKLRSALSDEDDDDNGSDLFGDSEKEEEDTEKSLKTRTKSFADELAERIQADVPKKSTPDQSSISSLEVKSRKEKEKSKVRKLPSDDEDDDLFKPPKLTDEDFLPFGSKGHLFSGGEGLFDDDEEGDLFAEAPKREVKQTDATPVVNTETLSSNTKRKPPVGGISLFPGGEDVIGASLLANKEKTKHPTPTTDTDPKLTTSTVLFDDELFGYSDVQSTAKSVKAKPPSDLFADEKDDLFKDKPSLPPAINNAKETSRTTTQKVTDKKSQVPVEKAKPTEPSTKKQASGLFSDEDDSEADLFSPSQSTGKPKTTLPATRPSKALSLFDDDDEEDLFGSITEKKPLPVAVKPSKPSLLPAETKIQKSGLFSSDEEDPVGILNQKKTVEQIRPTTDAPPVAKEKETKVKKTSLFDDEEDDLFAVTKDSQMKPHRVSLLFEEENDHEGSLFAAPKVDPIIPAVQDSEPPKMSVPAKSDIEKESLFRNSKKKSETNASSNENEEPPSRNEKVRHGIKLEDGENADLFPASPPPDIYAKPKSKTVLSLFEDEDEDNFEDPITINVKQKSSEKVSSEKSAQGKSTRVFQDEELLFSQELQRDNDPDVDLFASAKKPTSEKPSQAKPQAGTGLFGDEEDDDLFSSNKAKKPPKVQEKKTVIKRETADESKETNSVPEFKDQLPLRKGDTEQPTDRVPIKTKSPSSRIGKLQANLHINPASMLPGAVPKLTGARHVIPEQLVSAPDVTDTRSMPPASNTVIGAVSFENPAQIDTLHNANKTRAKVGGKRRPPTRMGRKLASEDSGETEDLSRSSAISATSDTKHQDGSLHANPEINREERISSIKVSLSENDIQSSTKTRIVPKPLTPDVNDLFGSDLFGKSTIANASASKMNEPSPNPEFTNKPLVEAGKKSSSALVLNENGSDDDLFQPVKPKTTKAFRPTSLADYEPEDDLFGSQKADVQPIPTKDTKSVTKDIFEDDIFATESTKPGKKTNEKKATAEPNLFDDNLDIFADLTQKSKDKKIKKKVEPKSIFDDDMDDIFSSSNVKKTKPKVKQSQPSTEPKSDSKPSSDFEDPLNVLGN
ncbi:Hypothetical predicted protein [Pelobates cultripes]|uniref:FAM21/CAPZIP domain-containing protein n=1 Tax=Pelobates cultripes TaxID=61616 RepID=A0AAD1TD59_PELCU|nr:Hypothetical predicted protein [Pelobates cultripes]